MCTARRFSLIIAATLRPVSFIPMNRESDRNSLYWLRPRLRSGFPIRRKTMALEDLTELVRRTEIFYPAFHRLYHIFSVCLQGYS